MAATQEVWLQPVGRQPRNGRIAVVLTRGTTNRERET